MKADKQAESVLQERAQCLDWRFFIVSSCTNQQLRNDRRLSIADKKGFPQVISPPSTQAQPSAPVWLTPSSSGPITYPTISHLSGAARETGVTANAVPSAERSRQCEEKGAQDWEPKPEEDWEGVEAPQPVPSRGATLMDAQVGYCTRPKELFTRSLPLLVINNPCFHSVPIHEVILRYQREQCQESTPVKPLPLPIAV